MIEYADRFGLLPSSPGDGTPYTLIACHDTEGAPGAQGAWDTASWMHATAAQRNASYHEIWGWDDPVLTVLRLVEPSRAAHSIAPQPISPDSGLPLYAPDAWVREQLTAGGNEWDPNQGSYAVAIAGSVAYVDALALSPRFLAAARARFDRIRDLTGTRARAEHFRYNPRTRSDWGRRMMAALGGLLIPDEVLPVFSDVPATRTERGAIEWAARERLMVGTGPGKFSPDVPLTRAQLAVILHRLVRWLEAREA